MTNTKKLVAFLGAVAGIALFLAPIAGAHTVSITATLDCNGNLSFTALPGGVTPPGAGNTGVQVSAAGQQVTGAFSAQNGYSFSGTFQGVTSSPVTVTALITQSWQDGNPSGETASTTIGKPTNCKTTPAISTTLSAGSITSGSSAFDTATLTGLSAHADGTVAFTVFSSSNCSTGATSAGSASLSANGSTASAKSSSVEFDVAGSYYWQAVYSGDATDNPVTSPCTAEVLVVNQPTTTVATPTTTPSTTTTTVPATTVTTTVPAPLATTTTPLKPPAVKKPAVKQPLFKPPTVTQPVPKPDIKLVKGPKSQSIATGASATFTITVTNSGKVTLSGVTVADPKSPACDRGLGTMKPGASTSYSCTLAQVEKGFTNTACATGKPPTGANVTDCDSANVTAAPFKPLTVKNAHHVVKKATPKAKPKPKPAPEAKPKVVAHSLPKNTG